MSSENSGLRQEFDFAYRVFRPRKASGEVVILLHGSGVDELTLLPLGRSILPRATLVAVRGRVPQEAGWRWFERITPTRFDQESIRAETARFGDFVNRLATAEDFDPRQALFLGYSNGANLVSSLMLLHPGLVRQAVLLRAMPVLDEPPAANLAGTHVLVVAGEGDVTYRPYAPALVALLRSDGAAVEAHTVPLGHEFGEADAGLIRAWLADMAGDPLR
jgi:phospholipase/carboxylesterase